MMNKIIGFKEICRDADGGAAPAAAPAADPAAPAAAPSRIEASAAQAPASAPAADPAPADPAAPPAANDFTLPDEYKEKGWAKNIKSQDDVYKMLDNAQAMAGKKFAIPDPETASQDDVEAYYNELRPKDVSEYKFADGTADEAKAAYGEMFHKHGLSVRQQEGVTADFNGMLEQMQADMTSSDGFVEEMTNSFGDKYEARAGQISAQLKTMMTPDDLQSIEAMPNKHLGVMYRFMDKVLNDYGVNNSGAAAGVDAGAAGAVNVKEKRETLHKKINELSGKRGVTAEEKSKLIKEYTKTFNGE